MNKKKMIILAVIIIVILCMIFIIMSKKNETNLDDNLVEISISETINIKDKTIKNKNSLKDINVTLPEFQNLEDGYEKYINSKIYADLSDITAYNNAILGLDNDEIGLFTYEVTYDRYNCGDYISIVANQYIHLGEGRPRIQKKCYVINVKENATVTLIDVVTNKTNYKDFIIEEINKQAESKNIELIGGNGLSELSDTQAFYIKDNKIVIYFEASEIAAAAVGELEFEMPFEMINNKFNAKT